MVQASASASDSNDIGDFADAYRDMRLDIEHMSYEVKEFSFSGIRNVAFINVTTCLIPIYRSFLH